jgi:hypothetical protein
VAVVHDVAQVTSGTTISDFSVTVGNNPNRCAYVSLHADTVPDPDPGITGSVGGVNLTQVAVLGIIVGTGFRFVWVGRVTQASGLSTGSLTVVINNEPATVNKAVIINVFYNVDQSTPDDGALTEQSSATSSSINVTPAAGDAVYSAISCDGGSTNGVISSANLTQPANGAGPGTGFASRTGYILSGAGGTIAADWAWVAAGSQAHSHIALNINQAITGRTTKNTRSTPLGDNIGMGFQMAPIRREAFVMNRSRIFVPARYAA